MAKAYKNESELLNTNWKAKQDAAEAAGNHELAKQYEAARNDKIAHKSYSGKQTQTHKYNKPNPKNYGAGFRRDGSPTQTALPGSLDTGITSGTKNPYQYVESKELTTRPGGVEGGWHKAADGSIWLDDDTGWTGFGGSKTDLRRRFDLKGQTANHNGQTIFYDENGYAHRSRPGVTGYRPHQDLYARPGEGPVKHMWTDQEAMTAEDLAKLGAIKADLSTGKLTGDQANYLANKLREGYGYSIDKQGWVTDLGASGAVAARRNAWGMSPVGPSQKEVEFMEKIYPHGVSATGVPVDYISKLTGKPLEAPPQGNAMPGIGWDGGHGEGSFSAGGYLKPGAGSAGTGAVPSGAEDYLRQMYESKLAAQQASLDAILKRGMGDIKAQDDLLADQYEDRRNQAAAQNDLQRMQMVEMGLANGLNTGATGQLQLGQSAAYQGVLGGLSEQQAADLAANQRARDQLYQQYMAQMAQAEASNEAELNSALYQEYVRQQDAARRAAEQAEADRRWQEQWEYQMEQDIYNRQLAEAKWRAEQGDMSGYQALGWMPQSPAAVVSPAAPAPAPVRRGGGYDNDGLTFDQIKQLQSSVDGLVADGMWGANSRKAFGGLTAKQAWDKFGDAPVAPLPSFGGSSDPVAHQIESYIASGNQSRAQQLIDQYYDSHKGAIDEVLAQWYS